MAIGLPPPPTRADNGDFAWVSWYNQLYTLLSTTGAVAWSQVDKAGSSIADLQNKNHSLLTGLQGGTSGQYYHLTAAEYATLVANDIKYGAWSNTASQTAAAANTAYTMTVNTTDYTNGCSVASSSRFTAASAGLYNIQFSAQLSSADASIHDVSIWLRKNGTDVANTNSMVSVPNKHGSVNGQMLPAWNFFIQLSASDYVELMWSTTTTNISIEATGTQTSPTRPATPSLIVTMDRVHA
ncbi:hypothetical protein UFOVP128_29 [uncultured Caudovirales phage]|uniref:C1q domain containing protein n=1 Tax=uncultured Caudovirales phage TaxID=2100421 RepID=A0A6J5L8G7_9CAUD|nr:hypothetical protein UFOVP128_29 [uncultured Caudovirales phage]CAB5222046.1 hypothetical protein UFOVP243_15 [uncultured Caudovirales phage]